MPPITFVVDRREAGQTLAAVLKARFGLSWSKAKRLVAGRHVKVSGQVESDVARRLKPGKRVELAAGTLELKAEGGRRKAETADKKQARKSPSRATPLPQRPSNPKSDPPSAFRLPPSALVYADDSLVVVNKPAGLTTMRHRE